jgi:hypothetical protein
MNEKFQKIWKRVGMSIGLVGLAGIAWTAGLWNLQLKTLPRIPNQKTGRIYPRNIHGIVVYQTRAENDRLETIQYSSITVFAIGFFTLFLYERRWGSTKNVGPPKIGTGWKAGVRRTVHRRHHANKGTHPPRSLRRVGWTTTLWRFWQNQNLVPAAMHFHEDRNDEQC